MLTLNAMISVFIVLVLCSMPIFFFLLLHRNRAAL